MHKGYKFYKVKTERGPVAERGLRNSFPVAPFRRAIRNSFPVATGKLFLIYHHGNCLELEVRREPRLWAPRKEPKENRSHIRESAQKKGKYQISDLRRERKPVQDTPQISSDRERVQFYTS